MSQSLFDRGLIQDVGDLYSLERKRKELLKWRSWQTRASPIYSIQSKRAKTVPCPRVIFALGIPNIGEETAELVAEHYSSLNDLARATPEALREIHPSGPKLPIA